MAITAGQGGAPDAAVRSSAPPDGDSAAPAGCPAGRPGEHGPHPGPRGRRSRSGGGAPSLQEVLGKGGRGGLAVARAPESLRHPCGVDLEPPGHPEPPVEAALTIPRPPCPPPPDPGGPLRQAVAQTPRDQVPGPSSHPWPHPPPLGHVPPYPTITPLLTRQLCSSPRDHAPHHPATTPLIAPHRPSPPLRRCLTPKQQQPPDAWGRVGASSGGESSRLGPLRRSLGARRVTPVSPGDAAPAGVREGGGRGRTACVWRDTGPPGLG